MSSHNCDAGYTPRIGIPGTYASRMYDDMPIKIAAVREAFAELAEDARAVGLTAAYDTILTWDESARDLDDLICNERELLLQMVVVSRAAYDTFVTVDRNNNHIFGMIDVLFGKFNMPASFPYIKVLEERMIHHKSIAARMGSDATDTDIVKAPRGFIFTGTFGMLVYDRAPILWMPPYYVINDGKVEQTVCPSSNGGAVWTVKESGKTLLTREFNLFNTNAMKSLGGIASA